MIFGFDWPSNFVIFEKGGQQGTRGWIYYKLTSELHSSGELKNLHNLMPCGND